MRVDAITALNLSVVRVQLPEAEVVALFLDTCRGKDSHFRESRDWLCPIYLCPTELFSKEDWTWCWVGLCSFVTIALVPFDSASGPSRMKKQLFQICDVAAGKQMA